MYQRSQIKNESGEKELFRSRAIVAGFVVFIALLGIFSRLFYLQVTQYDYYTKQSQKNYQKTIPIAPVRGEIYDRNGVLLAGNQVEYVLEVIQDEVNNLDQSLQRIKQLLSLTDKEIKKIKQKIKKHNRYRPVEIKTNMSAEDIAIFSANRPRFPGFQMSIRMERYYPLGSVAGHVLGYVGRIDKRDKKRIDMKEYKGSTHIGKTGIEKTYEKELHGKSGYRIVEVDAHGRPQVVLEEHNAKTGSDIYLSLDIRLQLKAEALLEGYNGAIVAIDPRNGEVLVMASVPSYDPNMFVNGISHADYKALRENPGKPLYSRALQGTYPPGSTIKPMVAFAGLNVQATTATRSIRAPGFFQIPGNRRHYRCWKKKGHGYVNLNSAIYQSCDVYFYDLAYRMGIKTFSQQLSAFGFGQKTGVDLPHERKGLLPTSEWKNKRYNRPWYPGDTVNIGIGQGYFNATPLQLAYATGIIAMRGERVKPHVVKAIRKARDLPSTRLKVEYLPTLIANKKSNWDDVIRGMENVVHGPRGTARASGHGALYRFAGKTGTAQVFGVAQNKEYDASKLNKKLHDHALFVAFAPIKKPEIVLAIIAENAGGGSKVAAPMARQLFDTYFLTDDELQVIEDKKAAKRERQ